MMTHPVFKLRWIKPANLEHNEKLVTKSVRFDEVVDFKTVDFFTIMVYSDGKPRTTLQSQAELQGLQNLENSLLWRDIHWSAIMFRKFKVELPPSAAVEQLLATDVHV